MKLEDVLPALREGKRIREKYWSPGRYIERTDDRFIDENGNPFSFATWSLFTKWEIVSRPIKVADYLVENRFYRTPVKGPAWFRETHPIGQQPEGSVLVPGSERNQE